MKTKLFVTALALVVLCGTAGAGTTPSLTYGAGPVKLAIFTDYYCPPCQRLEMETEKAIDKIINDKKAEVTFVNVPMNQNSVGITVHLIATTSGKPYSEMRRSRRQMYDMAKTGKITNEVITGWMNQHKKDQDPKVIVQYLRSMSNDISRNGIDTTPSCVITYDDGRSVKYKGLVDVMEAIKLLSK